MGVVFANCLPTVKVELEESVARFIENVQRLSGSDGSLREMEQEFVSGLLSLGQDALCAVMGRRCLASTEREVNGRGLKPEQVRLRLDGEYWATVMTTIGPVRFPLFAYRDTSNGIATVTRTPAREEVLPYHGRSRSTPLCLEWESRCGMEHPFRQAQEELNFFTHGSVTLEDTTIANHMVLVASLIERKYLYRNVCEIRELLRDRATRDRLSGRPILYFSSDAHSLPRYAGETWDIEWKNVNGIRLWCEDRATGQIIHLGGEFTWGDCTDVQRIFEALISEEILPADGNYGRNLQAELVWVSDAMGWFNDRILHLFPTATVILDIWHLLGWFAELAVKLFGASSKKAREFKGRVARLLGFPEQRKSAKKRCGHKKRRQGRRNSHAHDHGPRFDLLKKSGTDISKALLDFLGEVTTIKTTAKATLDALVKRICANVNRMDYAKYIQRGLQIGSGAMESLHRNGSQCRTKRPGVRWLKERSQAIFNLRMMHVAGRWEDFWERPELAINLAKAPKNSSLRTDAACS